MHFSQTAAIDQVLKIKQRNILKGALLPVTAKEIEAGYLMSPYFKKNLYIYLAQNKLSNTKTVVKG